MLILCCQFNSEKQQDFLNAMGSMFSAVIFLGVNSASSVQPVVDIERSVFYRERAAGLYSALPYALAQVKSIPFYTSLRKKKENYKQ